MKYKKPRCGEAFHQVLIERATAPRTRVANEAFVRREGEKGVQLVERLRSYRDFLDDARRHKARSGRVSVAFEQEVLSQARQARQDGYDFTDTILKLTKHFKHVGVIDDLLDTWQEALGQVDEVQPFDLWQDALEIDGAAEAFAEMGLSPATIDQLTSAVESLDVSMMLQEGAIAMRRNKDGRVSRLVPPAGPGKARSVVDLLFANQFDAVVSALDQAGVIPLDVIERSRDDLVEAIDPYEAILAAAIGSRAQLTRHVRRLEHTGLAAHQGSDPGTTLFLIGLAIILIALIIQHFYCTSPQGSASERNDALCLLGGILQFVGMIIVFKNADVIMVSRAHVTSFPHSEPGRAV